MKEAAAKRLAQEGVASGLGAPIRWQLVEWSTQGAHQITEQLRVLSSGQGVIRHSSRLEISRVMWWIFEKAGKSWPVR